MAYSRHHQRGDARCCGALLWTFLGLRPGGIGIQRATLFPRELFFWFFPETTQKNGFLAKFFDNFRCFWSSVKIFCQIW